MMIIDDFLECYDHLKLYANIADFKDVVNPVDNVVYPLICADIPEFVIEDIQSNLNWVMRRDITINTIFMRRSPDGIDVPHMAHTDNSMGDYSLMLYMNDREDGGTALLKHIETGMETAPESEDMLNRAKRDQNKTSAWSVRDMARMKQNRAFIFDAHEFHCALPIGGFGRGIDSRTVLTVFFS